MVRNTILEEEGSVQSKLKEAIFEPKMTRSKLREVMGKGQIPVSVSFLLLFFFWSMPRLSLPNNVVLCPSVPTSVHPQKVV